jgi:hypothetical protein
MRLVTLLRFAGAKCWASDSPSPSVGGCAVQTAFFRPRHATMVAESILPSACDCFLIEICQTKKSVLSLSICTLVSASRKHPCKRRPHQDNRSAKPDLAIDACRSSNHSLALLLVFCSQPCGLPSPQLSEPRLKLHDSSASMAA